MRTKLLLGAATLAAGIASSMAQSTVYSVNVVGYYNVTVPSKGYAFVANQLTGASGDNTINTGFANGFVSDPNGVNNTAMYFWNGSGFTTYQYYSAADSGSTAGWYDLLGNPVTKSVNQGFGAVIYNPGNSAITNTFVGQVVQGSVTNTVSQGFNLYSIVPPVSVDFNTVGFPANSDGAGTSFDTMYKWNGSAYTTYSYYNAADAGVAGWYDLIGNPVAITPKVGECFFINHVNPSVTKWVSSFTVQ